MRPLAPLVATLLAATPAAAATLTVNVTGVSDAGGVIRVAVYDTDAGFPDAEWRAAETVAATVGTVTVTFPDLPDASYAVSVLHDFDEDGELATTLVGIPREGVGVSNNYLGGLRRPSFERSLIDVSGATEVVVEVKYYRGD